MPFSNMGRSVSVLLEGLGQRADFQRKVVLRPDIAAVLVLLWQRGFGFCGGTVGRNRLGEMKPRRILSGHDAGARGRTKRTGRIGISEPHAVAGQAFQRGCLVVGRAIYRAVRPAQIVGQDHDDIWLFCFLPGDCCARHHGQGGEAQSAKKRGSHRARGGTYASSTRKTLENGFKVTAPGSANGVMVPSAGL